MSKLEEAGKNSGFIKSIFGVVAIIAGIIGAIFASYVFILNEYGSLQKIKNVHRVSSDGGDSYGHGKLSSDELISIRRQLKIPIEQNFVSATKLEERLQVLVEKLRLEKYLGIPKGMIAAFNEGCPDRGGWSVFEKVKGKYLLGSTGSSPYGNLEIGGDSIVKIETGNLPNHSHGLSTVFIEQRLTVGDKLSFRILDGKKEFGAGATTSNSIVGHVSNPSPIKIEPRFVALIFCIKD